MMNILHVTHNAIAAQLKLRDIRTPHLNEAKYGNFIFIEELPENDLTDTKEILNKEVILWFEHNLFGQLQLLQLLNWFSEQNLSNIHLKLISLAEHPGINPFAGFSRLSAKQMAYVFERRRIISDAAILLGKMTWQAFHSANPQAIAALLSHDLSAFPYLKNAIIRHLEEFPSSMNGLSRTEQYIVDSVNKGRYALQDIFNEMPVAEGKYYMGMDHLSFLAIVKRLTTAGKSLLTMKRLPMKTSDKRSTMFGGIHLGLTKLGERILRNQMDWVEVRGIDRWIGGVHLTTNCCWRWDRMTRKLLLQMRAGRGIN